MIFFKDYMDHYILQAHRECPGRKGQRTDKKNNIRNFLRVSWLLVGYILRVEGRFPNFLSLHTNFPSSTRLPTCLYVLGHLLILSKWVGLHKARIQRPVRVEVKWWSKSSKYSSREKTKIHNSLTNRWEDGPARDESIGLWRLEMGNVH